MSESDYKRIFSKNLKTYMDLNNKSQIDIVNDLHLSQSTVSNWCTGLKLPRMDKVQMLADYFGIEKSDLLEDKSQTKPILSKRDERDIMKRLEQTLEDLESNQDALMFDGEIMDERTRELLKASIANSITLAKIDAKKFTPSKYRREK